MSAPLVRVLRGRPTDEELAALVAVLLARTATDGQDSPPPSLWRDHTALLRAPLMAGRGAWRASALPY
ncbi:MAG: acyl-CoA carboxylase subunit epsilon [Actinomycetota bacterium]|nr:acyl-CoA carboxylase subunit epsilon [Actinomycetota bacterium]